MRKWILTLLIPFFMGIQSCGVYSLTGINIDPSIKTFFVLPIANEALTVRPSLGFNIQQGLINRILSQTKLVEKRLDPDLQYKITVKEYSLRPIGISNANTAENTRFSIKVHCKFINLKQPENNVDKLFPAVYRDFSKETSFQSVEEELSQQIITEILDNIINETLTNW